MLAAAQIPTVEVVSTAHTRLGVLCELLAGYDGLVGSPEFAMEWLMDRVEPIEERKQ